MKTLKLFNAVISKDEKTAPYIDSALGIVIEPNAAWAKFSILKYYFDEHLNGNDLNKTFHKSWEKISISSRYELLVEQITHYISTYGSDFTDTIYIPNEVLNVPDLTLTYKVIRAYSKEEMTEKCLSMLKSGVALKDETVDDIISILADTIGYTFTGKEGFKNKEAIVKIADLYGVLPDNPVEFLRYIIYRTTGTTLLIKSNELMTLIWDSSYNPSQAFNTFGLDRLAPIFNRFKPLFLSYKNRSPVVINKISKMSKRLHAPLVANPLNNVTSMLLTDDEIHWLDNATPFALFKALSACRSRKGSQDTFVYKIRNGKSWVKEVSSDFKVNDINTKNYLFLINYLKTRFDLTDTTFYVPSDVKYGIPTSEKMFVGNVPTGTKFYGDKLAVGVYWKNEWGARDLDLSGINIGGKVGWNSQYNQGDGDLMYSGDITNAPNGAVEYLYSNTNMVAPTLVQTNVFSGDSNCSYRIIVGKGDNLSMEYMMDPNKLFVDIKCQSVQAQTILGMLLPEQNGQCFILLNFGAGNLRVSRSAKSTDLATKALYQQLTNDMSLNELLIELGATLAIDRAEATFDLSLDVLEKDTIINIFKNT